MENKYYQRIEINGDVNRLPKEENDYYLSHIKGHPAHSVSYRYFQKSLKDWWLNNIEWYEIPVPSPDSVIVGPTEEEIEKWAEENCIEEGLGSYHGDLFDCKVQGANWYRSQCHAVNLKDELVKFVGWFQETYGMGPVHPEDIEDYLSKDNHSKNK